MKKILDLFQSVEKQQFSNVRPVLTAWDYTAKSISTVLYLTQHFWKVMTSR